MERRVLKFDCNVGTSRRSINEYIDDDISKAIEIVQRERTRDGKEKEELRQLNERFSHFLSNIEHLQQINEQIQSQLKEEFANWGLLPRDEKELKHLVLQINERSMKRSLDEVRSRGYEQEASVVTRIVILFLNIPNHYKQKHENLKLIIDKLQDEFNRLIQNERVSEDELSHTRDDLTKEIKKFRERSQDWLRLVIDKQVLSDDIQSLRERINLTNALNDEEINEWKRLLDQSNDDSISFYREELTNAIRDIKRDYSRQAKKFQDELEYQIEGQLRLIENQIKEGNDLEDNSKNEYDRNRKQIEEVKLRTAMEEYDKEQSQLSELTKVLLEKRRLLHDEEMKLQVIENKIRYKHVHERNIAENLRNEYDNLRGQFEQMAFDLRFSVEDELRIYARLLDELIKKSLSNVSSGRSNEYDDYQTRSVFQYLRKNSFSESNLNTNQSIWPAQTNLTTQNQFRSNQSEIYGTYQDSSLAKPSSFSKS